MSQPLRFGLILALVIGVSMPARADRVDRLIRILKTDSSYKVRLQVAIALGKLKDKRAVDPLIGALRDSNETVQGVAAAALGQIGARRALDALKRLRRSSSNAFVVSQATKAIARLHGGGGGANARLYMAIGKASNTSGKGGQALAEAFAAALRKEFSKVAGVTTVWAGAGRPSAGALRAKRLKGFVIDGAIISIKHTPQGGNIEVWCDVKVSLSTYPQNSMKAFYSGGAGMAVSSRGFDAASQQSLHKEIVEAIATEARRQIVTSYLARQ